MTNFLESNFHYKGYLILIMAVFFFGCKSEPDYPLSSVNPESKGYSSDKLELLGNHLETSGASSMLILVDGKVIFEWGDVSRKHLIHSIRKSLLNSLYGIAVEEGSLQINSTLRDLKVNDDPVRLNEAELDARVIDLLKSRSGIYHASAAETEGMALKRPERGSFSPGENFYYNNWDFNALGGILEKETGRKIFEMFHEEIAKPIGMLDFEGDYTTIDGEEELDSIPKKDGIYQYEKSKSKYPAYHFRMSTRDLALYGQLYLNYGNWNGKQILDSSWIDLSTHPYSIYDEKYGNAYGMLWRVRVPGEDTKRNSFYHTGLGIHMLGVYPDSRMVMVHRVDTEKDIEYNKGDFYKMLGLLFGAKLNN